jgi:hypothetical protein
MKTYTIHRAVTRLGLSVMALGLLAACGAPPEGGNRGLLQRVGLGPGKPDEFLVMPSRELEQPETTEVLPPPTPGGTNRVDIVPKASAIAALSGDPDRGFATSQSDLALIRAARATATTPDIRSRLAEEDAEYREDNRGRLLERLSNLGDNKVYDGMILDADRELERLRRLGVRTPAAPPPSPL